MEINEVCVLIKVSFLMKKFASRVPIAFCAILLTSIACNGLSPGTPTAVIPSAVVQTATTPPLLSQQVTLVPETLNETNQTPPFTITAQTPQLSGSDEPRLVEFNQRLKQLVSKEVDTWRQGFLQNTLPGVTNGSFLEANYTLLSQIEDVWSFKFDFHFYSDGAAHPGSYSITLNYDLAQGRELVLADLFIPDSDYLEAISKYCIAELSKQAFFDGAFTDGAQPTVENYRNWNISPGGLMITFDEYQVAPYAAGPQMVTVPYSELRGLINPEGVLEQFAQ
jgi:hypothetical protein